MRVLGALTLGDEIVELDPRVGIKFDCVFTLELLPKDGKLPPI